jgi:hypothetical protein
VVRSPIATVLEAELPQRGEFTVVIARAEAAAISAGGLPSAATLAAEFGRLTETGRSGRREILRTLATKYGVSTREVYEAIERGRKSGS